jgi:hypothetical protein
MSKMPLGCKDLLCGAAVESRRNLRKVALPPGVPDPARAALEERGVPERSVGGEYVAMHDAEFLPGRPHLLAFGRSGLCGRICLDIRSLKVVHVPVINYKQVNSVSASIGTFVACVRAAIDRFPSYDTVEELVEPVTTHLRKPMSAIDPTANENNSLWSEFFDDVHMGNYANEEFDPGADDSGLIR